MNRTATLVQLLVFLLLLAIAASMEVFVTPTFAALITSWGGSLGQAAQWSFTLAELGGGVLALLIVVFVAIGLRKAPEAQRPLVLPVATLLVALFLCLQSYVWVDMAIQAPAAYSTAKKAAS
jgi:hypothetical protein